MHRIHLRTLTCLAAMLANIAVITAVITDEAAAQQSKRAKTPTWVVAKATTSRAARKDAIRSLPVSKLSPADRALVADVVDHASMFRRMPIQVNHCDPQMYDFLVRNPEVIVNIWKKMGIASVTMQQTGIGTYRTADGKGTSCDVRILAANHNTHLIYADGGYQGALVRKPVRGKCVMLLKSGHGRETDGKYYVTSRMDVFIKVEHAGLDLLTKAFQPLLGKNADMNFIEAAAFIGRVSRTAERNPDGLQRLTDRLTDVSPEVRQRFSRLADEVSQRAEQRYAAQRTTYKAPVSAPR